MWNIYVHGLDDYEDGVEAETEEEAKKEVAELVARFSPGFEGCGRSFVKGERMWRITRNGWQDFGVFNWGADSSRKCGTNAGTPVERHAYCDEFRCHDCVVSAGIEY